MRKELFIETINALKKQFDKDLALVAHINQHLEGEVVGLGNHHLSNQIMLLLQEEYPPRKATDGTVICDIEYFCNEIDFGRKWREGLVTENDKDIKLETPEDLWNYLNYVEENKQ